MKESNTVDSMSGRSAFLCLNTNCEKAREKRQGGILKSRWTCDIDHFLIFKITLNGRNQQLSKDACCALRAECVLCDQKGCCSCTTLLDIKSSVKPVQAFVSVVLSSSQPLSPFPERNHFLFSNILRISVFHHRVAQIFHDFFANTKNSLFFLFLVPSCPSFFFSLFSHIFLLLQLLLRKLIGFRP